MIPPLSLFPLQLPALGDLGSLPVEVVALTFMFDTHQ